MENLEDFRKTGYTKNLFEAQVAKSSNQVDQGNTKYRKSSHRIEEVEDDEIVMDEDYIKETIVELIQKRKKQIELHNFLEQMYIYDDSIEIALEQFLIQFY
jgi:hypothetical protein